MALRHILVHVDESDRSNVRFEIAIELAQKFSATLTGLFAENDPRVMTVAALDPAGVLGPAAARAEARCRERVGAAGLRMHWETVMTASDEALFRQVARAAQAADIAIFGQHDPSRPDVPVPAELAEQVVLNSGRPVLIVPHSGRFPAIGRRVMVAWNSGREAARALNDAIAFLQAAEHVTLIMINPEVRPTEDIEAVFARLCRHLATHGITVETDRLIVDDIGAMDMLLARVSDEDIDLLAMGAHGHYGFPHLHRGGSTRHILRHMTVPVLMSH